MFGPYYIVTQLVTYLFGEIERFLCSPAAEALAERTFVGFLCANFEADSIWYMKVQDQVYELLLNAVLAWLPPEDWFDRFEERLGGRAELPRASRLTLPAGHRARRRPGGTHRAGRTPRCPDPHGCADRGVPPRPPAAWES